MHFAEITAPLVHETSPVCWLGVTISRRRKVLLLRPMISALDHGRQGALSSFCSRRAAILPHITGMLFG